MKFKEFEYKVRVRITLTKEEIDTLLESSAVHYDSICQSAGKQGGFIYGWNNLRTFSKDTSQVEITAEFRQLDLCCKILEVSVERTTGMPTKGPELYWELNKLLKNINDEYRKVNKL